MATTIATSNQAEVVSLDFPKQQFEGQVQGCRGDGRCDIDRREGGSVTGSIVASGQLGKSSWISPVAAVGRHIKPRPRRLPLMLTFQVTLKILLYFGFTLFGHLQP